MTLLTHTACTTRINGTACPISLRRSMARAYRLWASRRALARLTATQLEDVGVTRAQAYNEARRPVWDVPANWRS